MKNRPKGDLGKAESEASFDSQATGLTGITGVSGLEGVKGAGKFIKAVEKR